MKNYLLISLIISISVLTSGVLYSQTEELDIYHEKLFQYLEQVNSGNPEAFLNTFDKEKFTDRVFEGLPENDPDIQAFRIGFEGGLKQSLIPSLRVMFEYYDLVQYVSYYEDEENYVMLLRGTGEESGLNYIELTIDQSADDKFSFTDVYSYFAGEYYSSIMNRNVKMVIAENSTFSNILNSLSLKEKRFTENLPKLVKMEKYRNMGDLEEIVKVYDTIPESIRKEKVFLLSAIQATQSTDEERYINLLELYKDNYPDDPSLPLLTLDYYLLKGEIKTAQKLINELDEIVGGDNYLNIMRSNICMIDGDKECTRSYLVKALENDQYFEDAYWGLLEFDLMQGDFESVNSHLTSLENTFGYEFTKETMAQVELYSEYLKSDSFRNWENKKEGTLD